MTLVPKHHSCPRTPTERIVRSYHQGSRTHRSRTQNNDRYYHAHTFLSNRGKGEIQGVSTVQKTREHGQEKNQHQSTGHPAGSSSNVAAGRQQSNRGLEWAYTLANLQVNQQQQPRRNTACDEFVTAIAGELEGSAGVACATAAHTLAGLFPTNADQPMK